MAIERNSIGDECYWEDLGTVLAKFRARRRQRYSLVGVLLLYWLDSDLDSAGDASELENLFKNDFNYEVNSFGIPTEGSYEELRSYVVSFLERFDRQGNLAVVHYGGHGGRPDSRKSPTTWFAQISGGPELDWSPIQGLLFSARSDVAVFIDCCYAGHSVRPHTSHRIEFLAAVDGDQPTPIGSVFQPSFTTVLRREMAEMLKRDGYVTLSNLQGRMVLEEAGLKKQPLYVPVTKDSAGKIRLERWESLEYIENNLIVAEKSTVQAGMVRQLTLTTFRPLNSTSLAALILWLTEDAPRSVKDIELVKNSLTEAQGVRNLGVELLGQRGIQPDSSPPLISRDGQTEIARLLEQLRDAILSPTPRKLDNQEAKNIINSIRERSANLVTVIEDCLSNSDQKNLKEISTWDISTIEDVKIGVALRLRLLNELPPEDFAAVKFEDQPQKGQRFRGGRQDKVDVLVEYWPYEGGDPVQQRLTRQFARVSALHCETKPIDFRTLLGRGYLHEKLRERRFGFIFEIPEGRSGCAYVTLSDLIQQSRNVALDVRIRLASVLCKGLLHLHSIGWLHKGIKSGNILIFARQVSIPDKKPQQETYDFESPYYVGFDCARPADAETRSSVDFRSNENLYRHPERWGQPRRFERYHDLYAFGLLLFEIGRWKTLPTMSHQGINFKSIKNPETLRDFLLDSGYKKLAHCAGTRYADAMRVCLERRDWTSVEEWKFQRTVRDEILGPIGGDFMGNHCKVSSLDCLL